MKLSEITDQMLVDYISTDPGIEYNLLQLCQHFGVSENSMAKRLKPLVASAKIVLRETGRRRYWSVPAPVDRWPTPPSQPNAEFKRLGRAYLDSQRRILDRIRERKLA